MPYVDPADALNAPSTTLPMDPLAPGQPFARVPLLATDEMRLVLLTMPPGHRTIPHYHPRAAEHFVVLIGSARFTLDTSPPIDARPGDLVYAGVRVVHTIEAGPQGVRFLAEMSRNEDAPDEQIEVAEGGTAR